MTTEEFNELRRKVQKGLKKITSRRKFEEEYSSALTEYMSGRILKKPEIEIKGIKKACIVCLQSNLEFDPLAYSKASTNEPSDLSWMVSITQELNDCSYVLGALNVVGLDISDIVEERLAHIS